MTFTFLVKLVEQEPTMARLMTLPLNTDWTELMKLDFPDPTGPRRRTLASLVFGQLGWYEPTLFIRVVFCLRTNVSMRCLTHSNEIHTK